MRRGRDSTPCGLRRSASPGALRGATEVGRRAHRGHGTHAMQHHLTSAAFVTWALVTGSAAAAEPLDTQADEAALSRVTHRHHKSACAQDVGPQRARCFARIVTDDSGDAVPSATPSGYGPADLQSAYHLPASGGHGKTVAVIDAFDVPNAEADLAQYRSTFGLPPCTTASGCFRKVSENGDDNLPSLARTGSVRRPSTSKW